MKLIAIDPGMRTGYCESTDFGYSLSYRAVFDQLELVDRLSRIDDSEVTVIYEDFRIYAQKSTEMIMQELWAPETIGMIKAVIMLKNMEGKNWVMKTQWASNAKSAVDDKLLYRRKYYVHTDNVVGLNNNSEVRHAKDAARHMLYFVDFSNN